MSVPPVNLPDLAQRVQADQGIKNDYVKETTAQRAKLKKATQDFEAVFLGLMLKQMRKSLAGENALFGKSPEAKLYQEMMDDKLAERMSQSGSFGLAKTLYKRMESQLPPDPAEIAQKVTLLLPR